MMALNGIVGTYDQMAGHLDDWGGPTTFPHYAIGWAWATNTPFQWTKQVASHFGGTRNGMVLQWPARIKAKGEIRSQFHHVIDVAPTVLEAAGIPEPKMVNGVEQRPMDGVSMLYAVDDAKAADRRKTQYFEMFGNRAIYHEGWVAATRHSIPWLLVPDCRRSRTTCGSSTTSTRTSARPTIWRRRTRRSSRNCRPSSCRKPSAITCCRSTTAGSSGSIPAIAGRPDLLGGRTSMTVYDGMTGIMENAFINVKGVPHIR